MDEKNSVLTHDDISHLLQASKGNPDLQDAVQIVALTGIRPGELEHLQWKHIDFTTGAMSIHGKSGGREVKMDGATREVLRARLDRQFVFGPRTRSVIARVNQQLRAVAATVGLDVRTLRALRAAFVASLLRLKSSAPLADETNASHADQHHN